MATVVLGVTGCIGAYKACEVLRELQKRDVDVHVVMTQAATRFVAPMTFEALSRHAVFIDQWALGEQGDIRHISLADAADLLLVAPATANILGKDRKSTRLNSSHTVISYAVFCLKKKKRAHTLLIPRCRLIRLLES